MRKGSKGTIVTCGAVLALWCGFAFWMGKGLPSTQGTASIYITLLSLLAVSAPLLLLGRVLVANQELRPLTPWALLSLVGALAGALRTEDLTSAARFGGVLATYLSLIGAGFCLEQKVFSGRSKGLLSLVLALLLLVSPFCIDTKLSESQDPAEVHRLLTALGAASPTLALTTCTPEPLRLLKSAAVYRRFRIGEQVLPGIEPNRTMLLFAILAILIGLLSVSRKTAAT